MKKTMALIGVLSLVAVSAFAQYGRGYDDNTYSSRSRNYDERFDKKGGFEDKWGYDRDYNVVRGNKAMMIDSYQRQAKMRINDGMRKGLITRSEASRLMRYYDNIERKENRFMRNGRISRSEARELDNDLDNLNRMISREKRDFERNRNIRRY
jgi:hypothetical protein